MTGPTRGGGHSNAGPVESSPGPASSAGPGL